MNIKINEKGFCDYKDCSKVLDIELLDDEHFHLVTEGGIYCLATDTTINNEDFKLYKPINQNQE